MAKMQELVIKRSKWMRGLGEGSLLGRRGYESMMVGKMCCLGFHALSCGLSKEKIKGEVAPDYVLEKLPLKKANAILDETTMKYLVEKDGCEDAFRLTPLGRTMVEINDDPSIADKEREKQLKACFKEMKVKVKFVD